MYTEQECRTLIDRQLINAGWFFNTHQKNVFQERPKHDIEIRNLGGLRPDYILYSNDNPLAIIEAKKENGDFAGAKRDGFTKAEKIRCPIVYVSDSMFTEAYLVDGDRVLHRNKNKVINFLQESELLEHRTSAEVDDENLISTAKELIHVFKQADNILHASGKEQGMPRLLEFSNVLFVKMLLDIDKAKKKVSEFNWSEITTKSEDVIVEYFNHIISQYNKNYKNILEQSTVNGRVLKSLVNLVENMGNLEKIDFDIKGEAFEYFLKSYQDKHSDLAQYFTPRHIIRFILSLANPKIGDKIYDPFCGTGGFLIQAYKHIERNTKLETEKKRKLRKETVYGQDNSGSSRIAKMNMILVGDGHCNIEYKNTLEDEPKDIYDFVMTNIPFNLKPNPVKNNMKCIRYCINSLNDKGKAFIIVPYSIMEQTYEEFRQEISAYLERFIKLPHYVFNPYTNAQTLILVLNKNKKIDGYKTDKYKYIEIKHDGFSANNLREPIEENDIEKIQKGILKFKETDTFGEIKNVADLVNGDRLSTYLIPQNNNITLENDCYYHEPLISCDNTITTRRKRLGRNIGGRGAKVKKLIKKGDLVISTLHTQNGLFAIADKEYIGTSQLIYKINENKIGVDTLLYLLRKEIRKLEKSDVVGRETYNRDEIENLVIPHPTEEIEKKVKELREIEINIEKLEAKRKEILK
ncbi:MAG: N-6 DNA methylase [Chromatiales bacterium]|nr:N-6 DNA methylase [Chromatiales bacterium]